MSTGEHCRHEFVKIYQRKLKGLERRLVATKAYLPVGFKMTDFGHLSEGSYCFCTKCRARLFPKRTNAERAQARLAAAAGKAGEVQSESPENSLEEPGEGLDSRETVSVSVEELEVDAVTLEEIEDVPAEEEESA